MLYQEGWGVDAVKHSLVFSGGQSRGHVRTAAPARKYGFRGFSPLATPEVISVAESIPFIELTAWAHQRLYELKGQIVVSGIRQVTGLAMPNYPKRRFQHGAGDGLPTQLPRQEGDYRDSFVTQFSREALLVRCCPGILQTVSKLIVG